MRLQPLATPSIDAKRVVGPERVPGRWKGRIYIPDDKLLEPLSDEELAWISGERSP